MTETANQIIDKSGNSFHCKVTNFLKKKGWHTVISPYYMDNSSNKAREIDLIAEKSWETNDRWDRKQGTINIKLFVECKYIPQTNVFWFSNKDIVSTKRWLANNTPLREISTFTDQHHYLSDDKVAKLFASENNKNVENEVIYKALNQSLNAMVYLRRQESIIPESLRKNNQILTSIEMPVILCNNFKKFYRVDMEDLNPPEHNIKDNFQLEVNYAYLDRNKNNKNEFFLIDIIDFNKLDTFLTQLETDINAISQVIL